jgi:hypothetical protein
MFISLTRCSLVFKKLILLHIRNMFEGVLRVASAYCILIFLFMCLYYSQHILRMNSWSEFQIIVLTAFLLAIQSHLYSFALRFLFLQTHATSCNFLSALLFTVKEEGGKPDRKTHPFPYDLTNPNRNLKSGELSRLHVHEFGFCCLGKL